MRHYASMLKHAVDFFLSTKCSFLKPNNPKHCTIAVRALVTTSYLYYIWRYCTSIVMILIPCLFFYLTHFCHMLKSRFILNQPDSIRTKYCTTFLPSNLLNNIALQQSKLQSPPLTLLPCTIIVRISNVMILPWCEVNWWQINVSSHCDNCQLTDTDQS